jgi:AsmA protein
MKPALTKIVLKSLKISGIVVGALLLAMFLLPYLFPSFVSDKIRQWAKGSIRSELNFSAARLSFFKHFPALTLTLYDFRLKGSEPFATETLIEADEIALGVDISSALSSKIKIDKIFLTGALINIQVDTAGHANYNVYRSSPAAEPSASPSDTSSASLQIKKILIEKSKLVYNDRSFPMLINARDLYYKGNGDLSQAIFDLNSHTEIGSMDFYYNHQAYFVSKKINADLITRINTHSLDLFFDKNNLTINQLPVIFTGRFAFLKDGYDMDFSLKSTDSDLHDIFTAMPPGTLDWLSKTEMRGYGDIDASLKGQYIASHNIMPDLALDLKIRDGYVSHSGAPFPVNKVFLDFHSRLPGLNPDSLTATVDSLYFAVDKDYFSAVMKIRGSKQPFVYSKVDAEMDLERWSRAFGVESFQLKGKYALHLQAQGDYKTKLIRNTGVRKTTLDTVISSIPSFKLLSSLHNGYFKYAERPEAVDNISFDLDASCADNDYHHTRLGLENLNASLLGNYIKGFFRMGNARDFPIEAGLNAVFRLSDLKKAYPMDSLDLGGDLKVDVQTKGNYVPAKKLFPVTVANLQLNNGVLKTKYYPHPLEKIQVSAKLTSRSGSLKDLELNLAPVSFLLEGQPFMVKADLQDFEDLRYHVVSKGLLDIGKIAQVFALQGYRVKGFVETDLSLRGRQSDATAGRYDLLFNSGSMKVRDLELSAELFPQPFMIRSGVFRFDKDKMWFDSFHANYGKSDLTMNGYLSNVIDFMMNGRSPLKGSFDFSSDYLLADEFMAYAAAGAPVRGARLPAGKPASPEGAAAGPAGLGAQAAATQGAAGQTGVILVPGGLSITFNARVKKLRYNGIELDSCRGQLIIDSGKLKLNKTGFTLIGAPVEMDAEYQSLTPQRAQFDYHIGAKEFNVQRAYKEIKLFHDLASSASRAEGIISLDYHLSGKLDGNMRPVYPSLKGGGVLSVKKVKVKGLKLFGAASKESGKDINDPDLSKVDLKTTINNNLITIERTKMKISVFKLRIEGQASFDGKLNLKLRRGLPPFGVIGIPMKVTGTQENPKVKAGKGTDKDDLEETEDKEAQ